MKFLFVRVRSCSFQWEMMGVGLMSVGNEGKKWVRVGKCGIFFKCGKWGERVGDSRQELKEVK